MDSEVISALPSGGQASSPLLRNFLIKRMMFTFEPSDDPSTFNALDDDTGALPQVLAFNGALFWLDPDDMTSDHDGVAVIVTADSYRYKVEELDFHIRSALSDAVSDPPDAPSFGDVYLVPSGASGAWSSHQDDLAIWTRNGWRFETPAIGKWLLIEDIGGFKGYYSDGWSYGPGARSFDAASVPLSAAINFGRRIIVEDMTTMSPPGTAAVGVAYVIGASATGAWAGHDRKIAICEVVNTFTIYAPGNGWLAYNKADSTEFRYTGSAWVSAAGSWIDRKSVQTASGSTTAPSGSSGYTYSATTAPTTSHRRLIDDASLTYTAKKSGARLRFRYSADCIFQYSSMPVSGSDIVVGLFRDAESNAIAWAQVPAVKALSMLGAQLQPSHLEYAFEVDTSDASAHAYKVAIISLVSPGPVTCDANTLTRRTLSVEEAA